MSFQELVLAAQKHYPNLQIKYKNQSWFMKLLGILLFFNKDFMKSYTTTLGATVYFPNETFIKLKPVSSIIILLHELVHVQDSYFFGAPFFGLLYLFPQILAIFCIPLFFLISWKIALILMLALALPLPSFFRMYFEKKAYMASLYVMNALGKKMNFNPNLDNQSKNFALQFKNYAYYWMWPFANIDKQLNQAVMVIKEGKRPFEDPIFDILDELISAA